LNKKNTPTVLPTGKSTMSLGPRFSAAADVSCVAVAVAAVVVAVELVDLSASSTRRQKDLKITY
jgi:hypothetical protein